MYNGFIINKGFSNIIEKWNWVNTVTQGVILQTFFFLMAFLEYQFKSRFFIRPVVIHSKPVKEPYGIYMYWKCNNFFEGWGEGKGLFRIYTSLTGEIGETGFITVFLSIQISSCWNRLTISLTTEEILMKMNGGANVR